MNLSYNQAFGVQCDLTLRTGRSIQLRRIHQTLTYAGILEGMPNASQNDDIISFLRKERRHMIIPPRRSFKRNPGDMDEAIKNAPHWIPEFLPSVICEATFMSSPTRGSRPVIDGSVLEIVWFQHEWAMPILEPALSTIVDLDWDAIAHDFTW